MERAAPATPSCTRKAASAPTLRTPSRRLAEPPASRIGLGRDARYPAKRITASSRIACGARGRELLHTRRRHHAELRHLVVELVRAVGIGSCSCRTSGRAPSAAAQSPPSRSLPPSSPARVRAPPGVADHSHTFALCRAGFLIAPRSSAPSSACSSIGDFGQGHERCPIPSLASVAPMVSARTRALLYSAIVAGHLDDLKHPMSSTGRP